MFNSYSLNFILHTTVSACSALFTGSPLLSEAFVPLTSYMKETHVCHNAYGLTHMWRPVLSICTLQSGQANLYKSSMYDIWFGDKFWSKFIEQNKYFDVDLQSPQSWRQMYNCKGVIAPWQISGFVWFYYIFVLKIVSENVFFIYCKQKVVYW